MGYTAGTLDLSILGNGSNATSEIDKTVKSLNSLLRAVSKLNNITISAGSTKSIVNFVDNLSKGLSKIDTTSIQNLASSAQSIGSLSKISKLDNINYDKVAQGFSKLTTSISPFIDKVKEAESSLNSLYGILQKSSSKKISNVLDNNNNNINNNAKITNNLSKLFNLSKFTAVIYSARKLASVVATIAQKGAEYTETLNMWEVSIGDNLQIATKFVDKMKEAYGISEVTLMKAQATFKNMIGSLGNISDEVAYQLSEGITQMALDYSSLYNQTYEQAFTKFQAALAGQVRPIRSVSGYDITENTIYQLYQTLGGTKSMRQLSRTEKQLLAILAIFNQMSATGAIGDLNKTIESFANQSRIASESWKQVVSYAGIIVTYVLQEWKVLTYVNAILIFTGKVLKGLAEEIGAIQHFDDPFASTTEGAEDASSAVSELTSKLLDFDKFRSLNSSDEGGLFNIDEKLLNSLSQYQSILDENSFKAQELADEWIEKFGGVENIVKNITNLFNEIKDSNFIGLISDIVGYIKDLFNFIGGTDGQSFIDFWKETDREFGVIRDVLKTIVDFIKEIFGFFDRLNISSKVDESKSIFKQYLDKAISWIDNNIFPLGQFLSDLGIYKYENGGLPDKGTLFIAGESGAEMLYNMPSGQSGVANVQQIQQAMYNALVAYGRSNRSGEQIIKVYLDGEEVYNNTTYHANRHGNIWSKA